MTPSTSPPSSDGRYEPRPHLAPPGRRQAASKPSDVDHTKFRLDENTLTRPPPPSRSSTGYYVIIGPCAADQGGSANPATPPPKLALSPATFDSPPGHRSVSLHRDRSGHPNSKADGPAEPTPSARTKLGGSNIERITPSRNSLSAADFDGLPSPGSASCNPASQTTRGFSATGEYLPLTTGQQGGDLSGSTTNDARPSTWLTPIGIDTTDSPPAPRVRDLPRTTPLTGTPARGHLSRPTAWISARSSRPDRRTSAPVAGFHFQSAPLDRRGGRVRHPSHGSTTPSIPARPGSSASPRRPRPRPFPPPHGPNPRPAPGRRRPALPTLRRRAQLHTSSDVRGWSSHSGRRLDLGTAPGNSPPLTLTFTPGDATTPRDRHHSPPWTYGPIRESPH